jgi:hypothetical protein
VTYQAIVEEGALQARQDDLLRLGRRRFGQLDPQSESALRGITDPERLARMIDALLDVASWEELVATP